MILVASFFTLSVPRPIGVQADIETRKGGVYASRLRHATGSKTIEQRDLSEGVHTRLRVVPGRSADETEFRVERSRRRYGIEVLATGNLTVAADKASVLINDVRYGARLSLKSQVDPQNSKQLLHTLSFDGAVYEFAFDSERARALADRAQRLLAEGKREEASRLSSRMTKMLAPDQGYADFIKRIRNSSAFDALAATASLLAKAAPEETNGDFTMLAITNATKLLAPSAWLAARTGRVAGSSPQPKPELVKASFTGNSPLPYLQPTGSRQVVFCCSVCILWLAGIVGCVYMHNWCIGAGGGGWCDFFLAGCIAGDVALVIVCTENCTEC
jgi:hypothetical protein